jgi:uncharacterized damage-inducible protein DinB
MIPQNVQERWETLEKEQQQLIKTLSKYSNERLNQKPTDGGWSPMEVIQHLIIAETGTLKYIQKKLSFNPKLEKSGLTQNLKYLGFKIFFRSSIKIKAPVKAIIIFPEFSDFEETIDEWYQARKDFKNWLQNVPDSLWDKQIFKHPIMGRISINHTVSFFYEHQRRHIKQILKQF